jgi:hypothetical protein
LREKKAVQPLANLDAALLDDGVEAGADIGGELVKLVALIDFDGLASSVENDFAVTARAQMRLNLGAGLCGDRFVDDVVEDRKKLSAGH